MLIRPKIKALRNPRAKTGNSTPKPPFSGIFKAVKSPAPAIAGIPKRKDLGIGGCWNEAVQNELCGRFAVQLDSDDIYLKM